MKCDKHTMLLYAVTDRAWTGRETLRQQVEDALKGGVTCVQLREKELDDAAFLQEAMELSALCSSTLSSPSRSYSDLRFCPKIRDTLCQNPATKPPRNSRRIS